MPEASHVYRNSAEKKTTQARVAPFRLHIHSLIFAEIRISVFICENCGKHFLLRTVSYFPPHFLILIFLIRYFLFSNL